MDGQTDRQTDTGTGERCGGTVTHPTRTPTTKPDREQGTGNTDTEKRQAGTRANGTTTRAKPEPKPEHRNRTQG